MTVTTQVPLARNWEFWEEEMAVEARVHTSAPPSRSSAKHFCQTPPPWDPLTLAPEGNGQWSLLEALQPPAAVPGRWFPRLGATLPPQDQRAKLALIAEQ